MLSKNSIIITLIFLISTAYFSIFIGVRPLSSPDEGRYTEIAREMVQSGEYITPRLNGVKYFEKPPFIYWLTAGCIKLFGVHEWSVRLVTLLFAVIGVIATYVFSAVFYGRLKGIACSIILGSSLLYYVHSRLLILDLGLAVLLSIALFCLIYRTLLPLNVKYRQLIHSGFFIFTALAVLTKGLIGVILPGAIIIIWSIYHRRLDMLKLAFNPWGILLFLSITLPWHILAAYQNPKFVYFYFIHEHFLRFCTSVHRRYQPLWFFVPVITLGFFPWSAFIGKVFKSFWISHQTKSKNLALESFLFFWIMFIVIFFSISKSKLIPYMMPVFPPLAILLAQHIYAAWKDINIQNYKFEFYCTQILLLIFAGAMIVASVQTNLSHEGANAFYYVIFIVVALIIGAIAIRFFQYTNKIKAALSSILISSSLMCFSLNLTWEYLENRSIKKLTNIINNFGSESKIICYRYYYQDLPAYINKIVTVVAWHGELDFGTEQEKEKTKNWMWNDKQFHNFMIANKNLEQVFIVTRTIFWQQYLSKYPEYNLHVIAQSGKDILIANR